MKLDKEYREQIKQQKVQFRDFIKRPDILSILQKYGRSLEQIFKFFARQDEIQLDESLPQKLNTLNFQKLKKLISKFRVVPGLLSSEDLLFIFRKSTVNKHNSIDSGNKEKDCLNFEVIYIKIRKIL